MAKLDFKYGYYAKVNIYSGGYDGEDMDVIPPGSKYVETDESHGEQTYTYYYTDSNYLWPDWPAEKLNENGSRVYFEVKDVWDVSKGANNVIYVDVTTTVNRIYRGGITGTPLAGGTATRDLRVTLGDSIILDRGNLNIGIAETYMGTPVTMSYRLVIEPEAYSNGKSSVDVLNHTSGYPWEERYTDHIGVGTSFYNLLPKGFGHQVIYHWNGGHDGPPDESWIDRNECTQYSVSSTVPKNPHWVWLGWSTDPNAKQGTVWGGNNITVCERVDLYAIWRYTYRPGMHRVNGVWKSCDRDGATGPVGAANVRRGGKWIEMRIDPINSGLDDPPCIYDGGTWRIMKLIGDEGREHNISWDCPHQWN